MGKLLIMSVGMIINTKYRVNYKYQTKHFLMYK